MVPSNPAPDTSAWVTGRNTGTDHTVAVAAPPVNVPK